MCRPTGPISGRGPSASPALRLGRQPQSPDGSNFARAQDRLRAPKDNDGESTPRVFFHYGRGSHRKVPTRLPSSFRLPHWRGTPSLERMSPGRCSRLSAGFLSGLSDCCDARAPYSSAPFILLAATARVTRDDAYSTRPVSRRKLTQSRGRWKQTICTIISATLAAASRDEDDRSSLDVGR